MDPSDQERNDSGNGAPHGTDKPIHANGIPGEDHRWLRSVVENSSEIVTIVDPDGTLRYANPAWKRVLGYDPDEVVGTMNVLDHVHPDDLPHVLQETEEALAEGGITSNEAEYRFRCKDGSWRWMQSVGTYLLDDPAVGGVVVASRDVTERKEAEEALRHSEAELFGVLASISDGFFALDHELRFAYVNPQAALLLDRSSEDLVGERIWEDSTFYPEYRRAVAEGKTVRFEAYYPPLGAWYDVRAYPSRVGLAVYFQDVTERKRAEERLRFQARLLDTVGEAVIALDIEGRVTYWNKAAEEMYGWSSEEAMGRRLKEMIVPEDLRARAEEIMAQVREGRSWTGEFVVRGRDGTTFPVEGTDTPVFAEDGDLVGVIGVLRDITERKEFEERLREAKDRYRTLVEQIPVVTYIDRIDETSSAIYMSPQVEEMLGYTAKEWLEDTEFWIRVLHPEDKERVLAEARRTNESGDPFRTEYRLLAKDGSVVWVQDEAVLVEAAGGRSRFWQGVITDITERKALEERLEHRAFHDPLTNLPNRQLFMDRLGHALARTQRRRGKRVAVLFVDLDGFKVVNDSLGHGMGDKLLVAVGERLKGCLRPEDTLARFGGDEFIVLLEDMEDPDQAVRVAERITDILRDPFAVDRSELYARASIGIAMGEDRTKDPDDLLRDADTAMYQAKGEDSGYSVFDPAMYEEAIDRLEAEHDLRRAIEREEFVVHYQPIADLQSGEVLAVEALVRWEHPERGLLSPDEFMPVAEGSGLVVPMGQQVLREACFRAKEWHEVNPRTPPLVVSVNISDRQLSHPDLAETVERILRETGLEGGCLTLDVTETVYARALEDNTRVLDRIRAMGARVSIDDFGTGYSSLSYLKGLPADALKIDESFIAGLGEGVEDSAIVQTIIHLAHALRMEVIAEGVESAEQAGLLREMGCDVAQGFYFSKPLPTEDVPEFLAR